MKTPKGRWARYPKKRESNGNIIQEQPNRAECFQANFTKSIQILMLRRRNKNYLSITLSQSALIFKNSSIYTQPGTPLEIMDSAIP
ncbi:hypothetical protein SADUNF_Sadunf10G0066300 [Salix dunnii]|uniref:Uncharacterized protein n=1 Tax=Salix dunnii TaxID=1413687 RepID=A0A835JRD7_9ROSI|nr:hypothetical protein SADUNF_Sadunf10G0066300 [Salix dunnii]